MKACSRCKVVKEPAAFQPRGEPGALDRSGRPRTRSHCRACNIKLGLEWERLNPERLRKRRTAARLRKLEHKAGRPKPGACDICRSESKICWDHDHATGAFRGWLCDRCNLLLGHAQDSAGLLRKLADYLERPQA